MATGRRWQSRSCARASPSAASAFGGWKSDPTPHQIVQLETFADQAVIAIENARLFREILDRVDELTALGMVGQAVSSSLDLQEVLATIVSHAVRLSGADAGTIYELDEAAT